MRISGAFSDLGVSVAVTVAPGQRLSYALTVAAGDDFDGVVALQRSGNGGHTWETVTTFTGAQERRRIYDGEGLYRFACTGFEDESDDIAYVLSVDSPQTDQEIGSPVIPSFGTVTCRVERHGQYAHLTFDLKDARIPVTDAEGSGSYGALKLFDFAPAAVAYLGCSQVYEGYVPDGTGVPGDAVFEIGVGTAAIAGAANGALGATNDNIGADVDQTLSSGTTSGSGLTAGSAVAAAPATINLNWSGTAATIDGSGYIDVTGRITVACVLL